MNALSKAFLVALLFLGVGWFLYKNGYTEGVSRSLFDWLYPTSQQRRTAAPKPEPSREDTGARSWRSGRGQSRWARSVQSKQGRIYALLIGIDQYKQAWNTLRYAEKDIAGLYNVLTQEGRVPTQHVKRLLGREATQENVLEALDELRKRAKKDDTVLLMFAGHGEERNQQSYLILHDTHPERLRSTGLHPSQLSMGWKTKRLVVMLDACHSGISLQGTRGHSKGANEEHFAGVGRVVLSSSRQYQKSYEEETLGHGLFSYALMEALRGKADVDHDGVVTIYEAYKYAYRRLRELTQLYRKPSQEPFINMQMSGEIPLSYPEKREGDPPLGAADTNKGTLLLSSELDQIHVFVDGTYKTYLLSSAPKRITLHPGFHLVEFKKRGYTTKQEKIRLEVGKPLFFNVSLEPEAGSRKVFSLGSTTFAMRWIPQGRFLMGTPPQEEGRQTNEPLPRQVTISRGFWMMETEVTERQYKALFGLAKAEQSLCGLDCPIQEHSWHKAALFANRASEMSGLERCFTCKNGTCRGIPNYLSCLGWRLPTEAEWEYAARAGSAKKYTTGDEITCEQARYGTFSGDCDGTHMTLPVGSYSANDFYLYDMHGNVWEWVEDCYHSDYYGAPKKGTVWKGSEDCRRVLRGGSWFVNADNLRSAYRLYNAPSVRIYSLGFRVARN
ncbi:MAG: SUMF1/EgtB/PvdO family nonheme iron enzyme [Xanthomonadales bacterium]|nr:SUMF1/EgtB/PvdO family nonheme iron enzyme [Xanthomonadales bacterium]